MLARQFQTLRASVSYPKKSPNAFWQRNYKVFEVSPDICIYVHKSYVCNCNFSCISGHTLAKPKHSGNVGVEQRCRRLKMQIFRLLFRAIFQSIRWRIAAVDISLCISVILQSKLTQFWVWVPSEKCNR